MGESPKDNQQAALNFFVVTLFPDFFETPIQAALFGKALEKSILRVETVQLRDFAVNAYGQVDDAPYGGGGGMVLRVEPLKRALDFIEEKAGPSYKILLTPRGLLWNQEMVRQRAEAVIKEGPQNIVLICGHYEGVDERVADYADLSVCIGDYVLSGGEPAALIIMDTIARYMPGFMGNKRSVEEESFKEEGYLEYPHYTRPEEFEGARVPDVLLSGNHALIEEWRQEEGRLAYERFRRVSKRRDSE